MRTITRVLFFAAAALAVVQGEDTSSPFFKVLCDADPIFRGRADPIVDPGKYSQHSHRVFGGNHFDIGSTSISNEAYGDHITAASCTTCSISKDLSNYWIGDLYYKWPNGTISLVPNGGLTIYYLTRSNSDQKNPDFKAFPRGFRMTAGQPTRRYANESIVAHEAISYACLSSEGPLAQTQDFPTGRHVCDYGLRTQVFFPMCWDGVNLDSANHQTHVSYPTRYNGGDCPATHPVRLNGIFFEVLFDLKDFPHGPSVGANRFLWSTGDTTGYGLHGDFLNGWDVDLLQKTLRDVSCYGNNTNNGNNVKNCKTLAPFLVKTPGCALAKPIIATEDLGMGHLIDHLPGCNPLSGPSTTNVKPCTGQWPVTIKSAGVKRVFVQNPDGSYWIARNGTAAIQSEKTDKTALWYGHIFNFKTGKDGITTIYSENVDKWTSSSSGGDPLISSKNNPSTWETFKLTVVATDSIGTKVNIQAMSNNKYLNFTSSGIVSKSLTASTAATFYLINANAGVTDTRSSLDGFPTSSGTDNGGADNEDTDTDTDSGADTDPANPTNAPTNTPTNTPTNAPTNAPQSNESQQKAASTSSSVVAGALFSVICFAAMLF